MTKKLSSIAVCGALMALAPSTNGQTVPDARQLGNQYDRETMQYTEPSGDDIVGITRMDGRANIEAASSGSNGGAECITSDIVISITDDIVCLVSRTMCASNADINDTAGGTHSSTVQTCWKTEDVDPFCTTE